MKYIDRILFTVAGIILMIILYLFALNGRYNVNIYGWLVFDKWTKTWINMNEDKDINTDANEYPDNHYGSEK